MKVNELIEKLKQFDQELDILCYSEDESLLPKGYGFRFLDIESLETIEGEPCRNDDQVPSMKVGKSEFSKKYVTLNVTSEF